MLEIFHPPSVQLKKHSCIARANFYRWTKHQELQIASYNYIIKQGDRELATSTTKLMKRS